MTSTLPLQTVERLEITTLVDNTIDALLAGDETISRRPWGPVVANRFIDAPGVRTTLVAEHGFAALVTLERAGERHTLLFDAGLSPNGLIDNMDRLEVSPWTLAVMMVHCLGVLKIAACKFWGLTQPRKLRAKQSLREYLQSSISCRSIWPKE